MTKAEPRAIDSSINNSIDDKESSNEATTVDGKPVDESERLNVEYNRRNKELAMSTLSTDTHENKVLASLLGYRNRSNKREVRKEVIETHRKVR